MKIDVRIVVRMVIFYFMEYLFAGYDYILGYWVLTINSIPFLYSIVYILSN